MCVCERERVCVCVRERVCMCKRERVCVCAHLLLEHASRGVRVKKKKDRQDLARGVRDSLPIDVHHVREEPRTPTVGNTVGAYGGSYG